jgi:PAS domain S-box-containing protein
MNSLKFPKWKISNLLLVVVAASTLVFIVADGYFVYKTTDAQARENMIETNKRTATMLEIAIIESITSQNIPVLKRTLEKTSELDRNILFIKVLDKNNHLLTDWSALGRSQQGDADKELQHTVLRNIKLNGEVFGNLSITWSTNAVDKRTKNEALLNVGINVTKFFILTVIILLLIRILIVNPIKHLSAQIEGFSRRSHDTPTTGRIFPADPQSLKPQSQFKLWRALNKSKSTNEISLLEKSVEELAKSLDVKAKLSEEFRENETKLKSLISSSLDAIVLIDKKGTIKEYNPAAEQIFGFLCGEAIGENLGELIIPETLREMHHNGMRRYNETGEAVVVGQRLELSALHKNGHEFPVEVAIVPVTLGGDTYFSGFLRDQTKQKAAENASQKALNQAEQAAQAKSDFLTTMSHEIRTPLNALVGILGLLADTKLNDEQSQLVHTGLDSGEHLSSIISDILDFSKLESGKATIESNQFNLKQLMLETVDILRTLANKKSLPLKLEIDNNTPETVIGDHGRFRQVLINLVNNAIKFTHAGHIAINLSLVGENQHGVRIRCDVTDTGSGVETHIKDRLFDEFFMVDQSYSRRHEGTGLGLAISKRMITLMGGNIGFESVSGQGSNFFFEIPMLKMLAEDETKSKEETTGERIPASGKRVLVAEDNQANQMIAKKMLEAAGLKVDIAANGLEAVEAVRTLPYDVVLMDLSMPFMDGLEATKSIRKLSKPACLTPIIALTAHASAEDKQRCLLAGMNDYLQKPINRAKTLDCIARWASHENIDNSPADAQSGQLKIVETLDDELISKSVLQQLVNNTSLEVLPELVELYCEEVEHRVTLIRTCLADNDIDTIQFETHSIGSSAASYGNIQLHNVARRIEQQCKDKLTDQALSGAANLPDLAERSVLALKTLIKEDFS